MALYLGDKLISSNLAGGDTTPIGSVIAFAGSNAPVGYLMCDGSAVSRETYADLFTVIGTTYGSGDGSTTFNLPDFKEEYKKVLLWTNSNPSSAFASQDVSMPANTWNKYDFIEVLYKITNTENDDTGFKTVSRVPCHSQGMGQTVLYTTDWYVRHRQYWWNDAKTALHFDSCYYNQLGSTGSSSTGQNDAGIIPYKIYGIKETTPIIKATHNVTIQGVDTMSEAEYQDLLERLV